MEAEKGFRPPAALAAPAVHSVMAVSDLDLVTAIPMEKHIGTKPTMEPVVPGPADQLAVPAWP